jgi:hypothetical protein
MLTIPAMAAMESALKRNPKKRIIGCIILSFRAAFAGESGRIYGALAQISAPGWRKAAPKLIKFRWAGVLASVGGFRLRPAVARR